MSLVFVILDYLIETKLDNHFSSDAFLRQYDYGRDSTFWIMSLEFVANQFF